MKEPIEELFKESLGNHELPFNEAAWSSMNARLDGVPPSGGANGTGNVLKYVAGIAGVAILSAATYMYISSSSDKIIDAKVTAKTTQNSSQENAHSTDQTDTPSVLDTKNTTILEANSPVEQTINPLVNQSTTSTSLTLDQYTHEPITGNKQFDFTPFNVGELVTTEIDVTEIELHKIDESGIPDPSLTPADKMIVPTISGMCLGEEFVWENENNRYLVVLDNNGNRTRIPSKTKKRISLDHVGNYRYGFFVNGAFQERGTFSVNASPSVNFDLDTETKYEAGLPTTKVKATGVADTYTWKSKDQTLSGRSANFHFFESGSHTIELTATNGVCSITQEEAIYVESYNLMAVNAFDPNVNDPRNNTFLPYALTQRNTSFQLIIFDSRNGEVVYETTDASQPWDGTDRRTGKKEDTSTIYIWKVVIENPQPGEPNEYKGSIMKL